MRASLTLTGIFAAMMMASNVSAHDSTAPIATDADKCFSETLENLKDKAWGRFVQRSENVTVKDHYTPNALYLLGEGCETQTGTTLSDANKALIRKGFAIEFSPNPTR